MTSFYAGSTEHEWKIQNHETLEKTDNQVRVNTYEKKKNIRLRRDKGKKRKKD